MSRLGIKNKKPYPRKPVADRFLSRVEKKPGCWTWKGCRNELGYPIFWLDGHNMYAHRQSYKTFVGPVPKGMVVMHKCDNPGCVNPEHLRLGTDHDNMHDRISKRRGRIRFQARDVIEIRRLRSTGLSQAAIGKKFGVGQAHISQIIRRMTWKHI